MVPAADELFKQILPQNAAIPTIEYFIRGDKIPGLQVH